jgi:N-acyl-D-aspartate/D-glutamate deacylase
MTIQGKRSDAKMYDLVIRNGTIVDGLGGEPYVGDVAVSGGLIRELGTVTESGAAEIDATGLLVTPGFVDLHTHYDGQAIWSGRLNPSSAHGVTTAVMGNCGVGFAPCRPEDHETLVDVMAGVEDIPGVVMVDGLPWTWETFPEFLDALDARHTGHRCGRVPAALPAAGLCDGRARRQPGTGHRRGSGLDAQAGRRGHRGRRAGLRLVALTIHKTQSGQPIPSFDAAQAEIEAIARGVHDAGGGLIQFVPDLFATDYEQALQSVFDAAATVGLPVTFTLAIGNAGPPLHLDALRMVEKANDNGGEITAQIFPRPIGLVLGSGCPAIRSCCIPATVSSQLYRWPSGSPRCANPKCGNGFSTTPRPGTGIR